MTDLSNTLLIMPCCKSKQGVPDPGLPSRRIVDFVRERAARLLAEGRELAFQRPHTHRDRDSEIRPAIAYYTGNPYKLPGLREQLVTALQQGLHCVIVSGGYGLLRPEEPIHYYEAHLPRTLPVWRDRLPAVLRDYIAHNGIQRTFGAFSTGYATVVPDDLTGQDDRYVPTFDPSVDSGSAVRVVPERAGQAVLRWLHDGTVPEADRPVPRGSATETARTPPPSSQGVRPEDDAVWERIEASAGETFHLKRGKAFTYHVAGRTIKLHTTNWQIPRSDIARALPHVPFPSTTVVNRLGVQAPSYVYAILMDPRIRDGEW